MTPMGRKRGFDEAVVLEAVRDRFWACGYDGTSTYDLMEVTGLGKGSIYKAFGNKRDLYLRTLTDYADALAAAVETALSRETHPSPRVRLERFLLAVAEAFTAQTPRHGCYLAKGTVDRAAIDEAVAEVARRSFERIAGLFERTVREAQEVGEMDSGADAKALGYLATTVMRGIDGMARAGVDRAVLMDTVRTSVRCFSAGPAQEPHQNG